MFVDVIPFVRRASSGSVVVEVVWPLAALYDRVLADVDHLEGYGPDRPPERNLYERIEVVIKLDDGSETLAWMYQIGPSVRCLTVSDRTTVPSGDYADVRDLM